VGTIARDVRYGMRGLTRNPLFTLVAALSLGLGIGANSALFSMFNSLLWRPLPVEEPDRLAIAYTRTADAPFYDGFSYPEFHDYAAARPFENLAAYSILECAVSAPGEDATRIYGEGVTGAFFQVVKPRMHLGRGLRPEEGSTLGRDPVVVISYRFWQRRFQADPAIVGRAITLNNQPFTVVGVTAPEFHGVYAIYFFSDFWAPLTMMPQLEPGAAATMNSRDERAYRLIGRLRPGQTVAQAQAAMQTVSSRLDSEYPGTNRGIRAYAFRELETRPEVEIAAASTGVAMIFLAVTGLVLLIACANVANLLLARSSARRNEIAMRAALGASRWQIVRQLLVESTLLALIAGAAGLLVGSAATGVVSAVQVPTDLPLVFDFETDLRVILFTLAISVFAGIAFGLLPALRTTRGDLVPALKQGGAADFGRRRLTLSNGLVIAQVAASLVLLIVAGLCLKGIGGARTIDPGFKVANRLVFNFSPQLVGYDGTRSGRFYQLLMSRVRQLPNVEGAAVAHFVPLDFSSGGGDIVIEGRATEPGKEKFQTLASAVDEGYFETLGTRMVQGRAFDERDTASSLPVAIVNETFAKTVWPGRDPIGRRLRYDLPDGPFLEVVGVAADGKYRQLTESPRPYLFLPFAQRKQYRATVVVAYKGDMSTAVAAVRREVKAIDPAMPVFEVKTMDQFLERAMTAPRMSAMLAAPAGILAAIIAAMGLYGVMAYSVSRRTREVGIRMAIGAAPLNIVRMVMRQGMTLAGVGLVVGLALALAGTRFIEVLLFGVTPTDPLVFAGVPLLLAAVAATACYIPARRAVKIDPLRALRSE
jgi:macrolide transport system ATP-binding/permease protein